ncbi:hypothetical protein Cgig2_017790 [Carnegiea gigantea]|uniref:Uncharacterized protein n=1 Tax=Carnegiea gigantea TaxID=171969 RepID=A0A9Q1KXB5_9CARY|nr:hypothetical protein Cgig2_017790 [Carnegiea gigantea]
MSPSIIIRGPWDGAKAAVYVPIFIARNVIKKAQIFGVVVRRTSRYYKISRKVLLGYQYPPSASHLSYYILENKLEDRVVGNRVRCPCLSVEGLAIAFHCGATLIIAKKRRIQGETFRLSYKPPAETPHVPVSQNFKVDHHPGGGHWFAAGLSPNVPGRTLATHAGQHLQGAPYAHGSSYGSFGSHNSYTDCSGLGGSYGSYGDNFNTFTYFSPVGPSAMNIHPQGGISMVGTSPDARWRIHHRPHGLGVSPSMGNFTALPLGISPSQFTPPSTFSQVSSSPGHYGSMSPARGTCQGSPLGKGVAVSHFSRRKSSGYSENQQSLEGPPSLHLQGHFAVNTCSSQGEVNSQVSGGPWHMPLKSNVTSWKQLHGSSDFGTDSSMQLLQAKRIADENLDAAESPDPGDWDPNYSDELLLQEDSSDASSIASDFSRLVHVDQAVTYPQTFGIIGRFNHDSNRSSNQSLQR